ncbi:hypothetical protein JXB41_03935 [Candidatus Woesearchaeota archaeon]|nr:hypothetical protein [Candidatus Woesearchaeota archaeon]
MLNKTELYPGVAIFDIPEVEQEEIPKEIWQLIENELARLSDLTKLDITADDFHFREQYQGIAIDITEANRISQEVIDIIDKNTLIRRQAVVAATAIAQYEGRGAHTAHGFGTSKIREVATDIINGTPGIDELVGDTGGHGNMGQIADAMVRGNIHSAEIITYRQKGTRALGHHEPNLEHPEKNIIGTMPSAKGRLGHGLGQQLGYARGIDDRHVVIITDGDIYEGGTLEAIEQIIAEQENMTIIVYDNSMTIAGRRFDIDPYHDLESMLLRSNARKFNQDWSLARKIFEPLRCWIENKNKGGPIYSAEVCEDIEDTGNLVNAMKRALRPGKGPRFLIVKDYGAHDSVLTVPAGKHDGIILSGAIAYLRETGADRLADILGNLPKPVKQKQEFRGCSDNFTAIRKHLGTYVAERLIDLLPADEIQERVVLYHNDVPGSSGGTQLLDQLKKEGIDIQTYGRISEMCNFLAAAEQWKGGKQIIPIYLMFSGFIPMILSAKEMEELSGGKLWVWDSHDGTMDMADGPCHFGGDVALLGSGIKAYSKKTQVQLPGDVHQAEKMADYTLDGFINRYDEMGMTFTASPRGDTPEILKEDGSIFYDDKYEYDGTPDTIRTAGKGCGYVVATTAQALCSAIDAVDRIRDKGKGPQVGLIYWNTLSNLDQYGDFIVNSGLRDTPYILTVSDLNRWSGLDNLGTMIGNTRDHTTKPVNQVIRTMAITQPGNGCYGADCMKNQRLDLKSVYTELNKLVQVH